MRCVIIDISQEEITPPEDRPEGDLEISLDQLLEAQEQSLRQSLEAQQEPTDIHFVIVMREPLTAKQDIELESDDNEYSSHTLADDTNEVGPSSYEPSPSTRKSSQNSSIHTPSVRDPELGIIDRSKDCGYKRYKSKDSSYKRYKCLHCSFTTNALSSAKRHTREIHNNLKTFTCSHCKKKSSRESDMIYHIVIKHNPAQLMKMSPRESERDGEGMLRCPACPYKSQHMFHVRRHIVAFHIKKLPS